ncbi:MAG: hypothetical protein ACYDIE_04350 [Candidatus Krumholzibacteriia bacterium]
MRSQSLEAHLPILLLLTSVVYVAFSGTLSAPFSSPLSFEILNDAELLSRDPGAIFRHAGSLVSQPVLQLLFLAQYRLFGLEPFGYHMVSLFVHVLNSFLVYLLVNLLFPRRRMAVLASVMFALTVGSYGKVLLSLSSHESLVLANLYLLVLYCMIRNDFRHGGRVRSRWFWSALAFYAVAGLTAQATFSLLGCLIAYKFFFHTARGRRAVLSPDLLILMAISALFYAAQHRFGQPPQIVFSEEGGALHFTWISFKNIFRYLTLMLFPLQNSPLVRSGDIIVHVLYDARTVIRVFLAIAIVSFSFFGLVFGGRSIRFFIAWTYITLLPFTGIDVHGQWLNLRYLYLVALGFCVVLAAGAVGCSDLLSRHRFKRFVPYLVPAAFALGALMVTYQLDQQNRRLARGPEVREMRRQLEAAIAAPDAAAAAAMDSPDRPVPPGRPGENASPSR